MQNALLGINSVGDKQGVLWGIHAIFNKEVTSTTGFKNLASVNPDFSLDTESFLTILQNVDLIDIRRGKIEFTKSGIDLGLPSSSTFWTNLTKHFYSALLSQGGLDNSSVRFDPTANCYVIAKNGFKLRFALLRNLIIQIGGLIEKNGCYYVRDDYLSFFEAEVKQRYRKISLEKLKSDLEKQQIIGDAGEKFALGFEKNRVSIFNQCLEKNVKLISDVDVAAGYDMVSYEKADSKTFDRFIEIKTFSGMMNFHWSKNEMKKAALLRDKYWLYLVDYNRINEKGYQPTMIQNPYIEVYQNLAEWFPEVDSIKFSKIDSEFED